MKHTNAAIIEYVKRFIATDSDNYPEQMRQTFFINCPALFSGVYALVKGFMDANTQYAPHAVDPTQRALIILFVVSKV
jgi:hypothetical protein